MSQELRIRQSPTMDQDLESIAPDVGTRTDSSTEAVSRDAVDSTETGFTSNEAQSDAKNVGKHEIDAETIMKYNDDAVYKEHLKLFLDQTELELKQKNHESHSKSVLKRIDLDCPLCTKKFKLKTRLDLHIRKSHITSHYLCNQCDFKTNSKKEVQDHAEENHGDSNTFNFKETKVCIECNKTARSYKSLIKHISVHRTKYIKLLFCVDCGYKAENQKELKSHNSDVHETTIEKGEKRSCPLCDYQTEWGKSHLDRHIRAIHDRIKDFKCPFCEISCSQKGNLRLHIDQVHKNIRKFSCDQCDYKSNFKNDIAKHKKSVHEKTKDIQCKSCSFSTTLNSYLNIHVRTVHGESRKEHLCTHCGKQFRVFRNLFNHIKVIHPFEQLPENPRKKNVSNLGMDMDPTSNTSELKPLSWKDRQDLVYKMKQPQKRVVNGKTYHRVSCPETGCDYTTLWGKNHLRKHIKAVHQKMKDIRCRMCEYVACQNIHMSTHLKLVHLTCHHCGLRFWEHMEETASSCQHCDVKFPLRRHLVRHMKVVHPDKPLPCKVVRVDGKSLRISNESEFQKDYGSDNENISKRKRYNENLQALKTHIKCQHPPVKRDANVKNQACPDCDYKTTDKCHLNEHIKAVHHKIKDFLCEQCSYATSRKSNLVKHIDKQHGRNLEEKVKMLTCPKCGEHFAGQDKLNDHVANIHPELKRLRCHLCSFQTKDGSHLKRHIKAIHDKIKDHNCPHCTDTFSDKSNMLKHIKAVHLKIKNVNHKPSSKSKDEKSLGSELITTPQLPTQAASDSIQSKISSFQSSGVPNIDNSSSNNEISCLQCRFQTHSQDLIEKHVKDEHEKIKNLACQQCSYVTWTRYNLDRHIKRCHDRRIKDKDLDNKDLQCTQCNYKTALPDRLAKHFKEVHETAKDISCNFCKYQTKRKSNLQAHMQRVHEKNKKHSKNQIISQEIVTTLPFSIIPSTTTEIITVPVVQQEVQIQSGKWEQPTIVYQQHSYFITDQI